MTGKNNHIKYLENIMPCFTLAPRYHLDDESAWLEGVDPSRHYWLWVNGEHHLSTTIPGLNVASGGELKQFMEHFWGLGPGESLTWSRAATELKIHCVTTNCYGVEDEVAGAVVWHLFDRESLESLLMTASPRWQCRPEDVGLGRRRLWQSLNLALAA